LKSFIKITLILLIVWPESFFGQTYFNMLYPPEVGTWGSGTESVVVTENSYFMNRWFADNLSGQLGHHFTKVDLDGVNYEVTDTIHNSNQWISVASLTRTENKTFIDMLSIHNYNPTTQQYALVKYDSLGHIIFQNTDTNLYPYIYVKQVISLPDGQIISVGNLRPNFGSSLNERFALLIKSDSLGNEIWKKTFNIGNYIENGESIALCTDGGFIIGGAELIINGPDDFYSPIVIKTDSNGNVQWKRKYGSTQYSNWPAYGITQTQDGGYAFCGGVGVNHNSNIDQQMPWIVKLDSLGNMLWADTNTGILLKSSPDNVFFSDIIELHDGSLVTCGQQKIWYENKPTTDKHRWRGVIKKISSTGVPIWARYYDHPEINDLNSSAHVLNDIDSTPDGGFVAAGYATFTSDYVQSTWVIKVDSFGCLVQGCEVNSVPKIQLPIAELKVYPNPASEILNIEITPQGNQQEFVFELYDILGKRVLTKTLYSYENTINVGNLASGVYTYKIGAVWGKIVVE